MADKDQNDELDRKAVNNLSLLMSLERDAPATRILLELHQAKIQAKRK